MVGGDGVEKYLKALAHPARRRVIVALAEKKSLSYSELMRISGIEDSGTFAFHLRMLQGLVEKDPETGEYRLTEEGLKAYRALRILYGETGSGQPREAGEAREEKTPGGDNIVVVSDRLTFTLSRRFAEKLASEGKRILITDAVSVNIEDMPEELLDRVLEGIRDVLVVDVPKNLQHIVELRSRDVAVIGKEGGGLGGFVGGVVRTILTALAGLGKTLWKPGKAKKKRFQEKVRVPERYSLRIKADASRVSVKHPAPGDAMAVEGEVTEFGEVAIEPRGSEVYIESNAASVSIDCPKRIADAKVEADASAITMGLRGIRELYISADASGVRAKAEELGAASISIDADASNIVMELAYERFEGESTIDIDADVSNIQVTVRIPPEVKVDAAIDEGSGSIEIDGFSGRHYTDSGYDTASSRIRIRAVNDNGMTRIRVLRS